MTSFLLLRLCWNRKIWFIKIKKLTTKNLKWTQKHEMWLWHMLLLLRLYVCFWNFLPPSRDGNKNDLYKSSSLFHCVKHNSLQPRSPPLSVGGNEACWRLFHLHSLFGSALSKSSSMYGKRSRTHPSCNWEDPSRYLCTWGAFANTKAFWIE